MRYIRKNNAIMEKYAGPGMGDTWYADNGYIAYAGALPLSRLGIADGAVIELPEPVIVPPPRILSKLKLRDNLAALGLWDTLKAAISADADTAERWALAQDVREDDADFVALCAALSPQLTAAGVELDALLNQCIMEG